MSNIHQNRINTTMTATQVANVKQALQTILSNMPFLTGLSESERIALPKMNVSNKVFVEDTLNAAANNAGLLPTISALQICKRITRFLNNWKNCNYWLISSARK